MKIELCFADIINEEGVKDYRLGIAISTDTSLHLLTLEKGVSVIRDAKTQVQHFQWLPGMAESKEFAIIAAQCMYGQTIALLGEDNFDSISACLLSAACMTLVGAHALELAKMPEHYKLHDRMMFHINKKVPCKIKVSFADSQIDAPPDQVIESMTIMNEMGEGDFMHMLNNDHDNEVIFLVIGTHHVDTRVMQRKPFTILI